MDRLEWNRSEFSHVLEDWSIESDIHNEVERKSLEILKDRYRKEKNITEQELENQLTFDPDITGNPKDFFIAKFSAEEVDKVYREVEQQVRQDMISRMKFNQQYKDQRHIGDLKFAERQIDISYATNIEKNMNEASETGVNILKDAQNLDIRRIFEGYIKLAELYNIQDTELFRSIIEKSMLNPETGILTDEVSQLIADENEKESFNKLFRDSTDKLEAIEKAVSIAKQDSTYRINSIKEKADLVDYFAKKFPDSLQNYHSSAIYELENSIARTKNGIELPEDIRKKPDEIVNNSKDEQER